MATKKRQQTGESILPSPSHERMLMAINLQVVESLITFNDQVLQMYPSLLVETRMDAKRLVKLRPVTAMINGFKVQYAREFDSKENTIGRFLETISNQMVEYNRRQWRENLISRGEEYGLSNDAMAFAIAKEPGIPKSVSTRWTNTQMQLIKRLGTARVPPIPFEHFQRLERLVQKSVHSGLRVEELQGKLSELDGISRRRAEVIARDQTNKYNGKMTEIRHASIGVKAYFWRTSNDDRVRDAHKARNGKRFLYSRPPADGAPGEAVQCRCWPDPDLDAVFKDIEKQTSKKGD